MSDTTYVLVPGAGGSAWYWHRVVAELEHRGDRAIAVELPCDDEGAGLREYADAIVTAIGDRPDVVLVAQSMAGFSAPLACAHVPVRRLVLVNAMIPLPGETAGEWWDATGQPEAVRQNDEREGREPSQGFDVMRTFLHDVPQEIIDVSLEHQKAQADKPFGEPWPLVHWPKTPTSVLIGRDDRMFPAAFQHRIAQERLELTGDEIPGGHLVALSRPQTLVDRLETCAGSPSVA